MSVAVSKENSEFLYQQVINLIRNMQKTETLRPGDKLPSLRNLSNKLSVSIPTVKQAYLELERQGIIEARPKSGYFLKAKLLKPAMPRRAQLLPKPLAVNNQSFIEQVYQAIHQPGMVPFGIANPAAAHPSDKALARIMRKTMTMAGDKAIAYGPMDGFTPLKRQLAYRYLDFGIQLAPDDILITNGAQEALTIALNSVARRGDVIAVESPCYFGILELIESLGMMALEIPLCPKQGIWLDDLQQAIQQQVKQSQPIKACIFSSSISNPLGSFMSDDSKQAMVKLLEQHDIPLIEDDVYGDLYFTEKRGTPALGYSQKGLVLCCSSFSKTAAPGYRVGWLIANNYDTVAKGFKRAMSCSSPLLSQWTLSEFIATGEYDRNMRQLRQTLKTNKQRMIAQVQKHFPKNTKISDPKGGGVLWLELPKRNDSKKLFYQALKLNISITPGVFFSATDEFNHCIRLSYGLQWNEQVENSITKAG